MPINAEVARRAGRQHGVLSRAQLLDAGLSSRAIRSHTRAGLLHRVHRCVYAVGHDGLSDRGRALAAVLACGDGAALSHRSAAALWRIVPGWISPIDVTAAGNHHLHGVALHKSRTLLATDTTVRHGIAVTRPARTLLDLADLLDDVALERAVNEAQVLRCLRRAELAALLARSPGRRGVERLRPFAGQTGAPTRSVFEDTFVHFVERYDLPTPELNTRVAGHLVDVLFRRERVVVELDGLQFHDTDRAFETDRERDADLLADGHCVVRITWTRLTQRAEREAWRLRRVLAARSAEQSG